MDSVQLSRHELNHFRGSNIGLSEFLEHVESNDSAETQFDFGSHDSNHLSLKSGL